MNGASVSSFIVVNDAGVVRTETTVGVDSTDAIAFAWYVPTWNPYPITAIDNTAAQDIELTTSATLDSLFVKGRTVRIPGNKVLEAIIPPGDHTVTSVTGASSFTIDVTGTGAATMGFIASAVVVEDQNEYRLQYDYTTGAWIAKCAGNIAYQLSGSRHDVGPGRLLFEQGYFVGGGSNRLFVTVARDRPRGVNQFESGRAGGGWVAGDRILIFQPSSGQPYEWVCTGDGSFSTSAWTALVLP